LRAAFKFLVDLTIGTVNEQAGPNTPVD
jgi:hypothetical protein